MAAEAADRRHGDAESSPEFITDDELLGPNDEADERLVDAALWKYRRPFQDVCARDVRSEMSVREIQIGLSLLG